MSTATIDRNHPQDPPDLPEDLPERVRLLVRFSVAMDRKLGSSPDEIRRGVQKEFGRVFENIGLTDPYALERYARIIEEEIATRLANPDPAGGIVVAEDARIIGKDD